MPSVEVGEFKVVISGRWLKSAVVKSAEFTIADATESLPEILQTVNACPSRPDIFRFSQRLPDTKPRFNYPMEWDNLAVLPILGYSEWWEQRLNQDTRRCVRIAAKRGLIVRSAAYDDSFAEGIQGIYNESPVRQGRAFWHYGKPLDVVKAENGTFADRSEYIGAYLGDEMVGFLKMVYVNEVAHIMQILSKTSHYDRRPMNALMAKAVETCNERGLRFLTYRKYVYHKNLPDSLTEFKRRNGFEKVDIPSYAVPLTAKGRIAVALGLHRPPLEMLPSKLVQVARNMRQARQDRPRKGSRIGEIPQQIQPKT